MSIRRPGLDNHGMGSIFEELVRRFNEENNEEAGEHWTPRDAVRLMAKLVFLPVADRIKSSTYLLYDGACGTGGMLTVAEETLRQLAAGHGKHLSTHLFGQDSLPSNDRQRCQTSYPPPNSLRILQSQSFNLAQQLDSTPTRIGSFSRTANLPGAQPTISNWRYQSSCRQFAPSHDIL